MPSLNKLSTYCTTVSGDDDAIRVVYHRTTIVEWTADRVTLRTGGWKSVTTKRKMNQAANQFGLGFGVHQRDHAWYVSRWNAITKCWCDEQPFDGDTFVFNRVMA